MTLTDAAAARVREIMDNAEKDYVGLRVGVKNSAAISVPSLILCLSTANERDTAILFSSFSCCCNRRKVTVLPLPKGPGTAATPPSPMS